MAHYRLPMDDIDEYGYLLNPSSLHAVLRWSSRSEDIHNNLAAALTHGVDGRSVRLGSSSSYVQIDTSALQMECFGDLNKCHLGEYSYNLSIAICLC